MYSPENIISIFYDQYILFVGLSVFISTVLYLIVRKQNFGFIDPLNFFWVFTFGTSYAVVIQLFINGVLSIASFLIILYFFIVLITSWYFGFNSKFINFGLRKINLNLNSNGTGLFLFIFLLTYSLLAVFYVANINWSTFFISRFEAHRGFGFLARIIDVIRLFVISLIVIKILESKSGIKIKWLLLFLFVLVSSFLNGAKFSILESTYLILIIISLRTGKSIKLKAKNILHFGVLGFFILAFAIYFTNKLSESIDYDSKYTNMSPGIEMLISRIIANGDMYYLGLPNDVLFKVSEKTSNFFELILKPYLGNNLTSKIFSREVNSDSLNIGRAIWDYWFPYSISGGSTDHFDLAAYSYFGFFGGTFLVLSIGFFIGRINKFKLLNMRKELDFFSLSFFSIVYLKSYLLLLSPVVGITTILDVVVIYFLYLILFKFLQRF